MLDAERIAALYPGKVVAAVADTVPECALTAGEAAALGRAADVRRREFAAGRDGARRALATLGAPVDELLRDEEGLPRWPAGVVGGISHAREVAVAVVGRTEDWLALAVDVETRAGLESHLWEKTLTENERDALPAAREERAALALFCAKEALYKCWYPVRRVFLGFHDVELERDGDAARIAAFAKGDVPAIGIRLLDDGPAVLAAAWWRVG